MTLKDLAREMHAWASKDGHMNYNFGKLGSRGLKLKLTYYKDDIVLKMSRNKGVIPSDKEVSICQKAFFGDKELTNRMETGDAVFIAVEKELIMGEMADEHRDCLWGEDGLEFDYNKCVYFAHPYSLYNTSVELECLFDIEKVFNMCIVNPRDLRRGNYDAAVSNSDMVVFMSDNNALGKGTVSNVSLAHSLDIPVYYYEDKVFYQGGTMRLINGGRDWTKYAAIVTRGEVYKSLKPRLTWFDKLDAQLLQWRQKLEGRLS